MKFFIITLFISITISCFSQDSIPIYNKIIVSNLKDKEVAKATINFQKKIDYLKKIDNLEEFYYAYIDYFLLQEVNPTTLKILSNAESKKWRETITNNEKIALLHLNINLGHYLLKLGNISKSVDVYEKALHFYQENKVVGYEIIEYCLKPLGNNYTRLGDYVQADEIFKYTIQLAEKSKDKSQLIGTYQNLSIKYQSINNYNDAIAILEKALQIKSISTLQKSNVFSLIAKNYYEKTNFKKALLYIDKSEKINQRTIEFNEIKQKNNITKGLCYFKTGAIKKAEKSFLNGLSLAKKIYGDHNRETAKVYNLLAEIAIQKQQPNVSLQYYQSALQTVIKEYQPKTIYENPKVENFYAENSIKESLDGRAKLFTTLKQYENAIDNYNLAFKIEKALQSTFTSQESKIIQQTEIRNRSEKIVHLYYNLYQKHKKQKYIDLAFESVEKSKAIVLSDILNHNYLRSAIKEDPLFLKEKKLLKKKAVLLKNNQLESLKNTNANLELLKKLNTQITKTTTELQVLKQEIYTKYPLLNSVNNTFSSSEIQHGLLLKNQQLVEFFDTTTDLYIFSLTRNSNISLRKIPKTADYNNTLINFISLFANGNDDQLKSDISSYQKNANYLYSQILAPELKNSVNKSLTIIPDGALNFLAFDCLLTKKSNSINFAKLPYLLFEHQINYGYSATILMQQQQNRNKIKRENLLGFFPVFKNNHRNLQEIIHTLNEEKEIKKSTIGTFLEQEKATKEAFLSNANKYDIIHLSTHASSGDLVKPAHIEFIDNTLYLPEIYGLNLNSKLLVLSACETGVGKLQKGEGAMSLARGFAYAGVQNLLVSLWKVNDKSTSLLMRNFYKNYAISNNKSNAIQQSKIDYLNDKTIANSKKTPYYWSSFVFIGNVETSKENNLNWISILIGASLLLLLFFILKKRHKKSQTQNK